MSETAQIAAIIAVAVIAVVLLVLFRNSARRVHFDATKDHLSADLETHDPGNPQPREPGAVRLHDVRMSGRDNRIEVSRPNVEIDQLRQRGFNQQVKVSDNPTRPED